MLCLLHTTYKGNSIITTIINQAHRAIRHFGAQRTADYIHKEYWWLKIGCEMHKFSRTCPMCQATKPSNQLSQGLGHDYLWVILCHLTSMVHLVPIKTMIKASELAQKFIQKVIWFHRLPETIVSDQDTKFTSKFWCKLHHTLEAKLLMSTVFHPQTDGASERVIRNVVQILQILWMMVQFD